MKEYYIHTDRQEGPYSMEQLLHKTLNADTPVWHPGLNEWTVAGKVAELQHLIKATPPPFTSPVVSEYEYQLQMEEYFEDPKKIDWTTVAWVLVSILSFLILVWAMNG